MKNADKIIIAFLVSAGLFSTLQAEQYVSGLSQSQKQVLMAAKAATSDVAVTDGSYYGDNPHKTDNPT